MRIAAAAAAAVALLAGCAVGESHVAPVPVAVAAPEPGLAAGPAPATAVDAGAPAAPAPWTFVVISDLHQPDRATADPRIEALVRAVIAERPRLVVITGDSTNGNPTDGPRRVRAAARWWRALLAQLEPLRDAGIPVLPVAGNHDAYKPGHRAAYADAWSDLDAWADPLELIGARQPALPGDDVALDAAPFSYGVRVDGVHLALAHVVSQRLAPEVEAWLAADLAAAADADLRIVFGHVPMASVMSTPRREFVDQLGGLLAAHNATIYVAGHEHLVWDEDHEVPGGVVRQVLVGTGSGSYNYGPGGRAMKRAGCSPTDPGPSRWGPRFRCRVPRSGAAFALHDNRWGGERLIQHAKQTYTVFTVDGTTVHARPVALTADGEAVAFDLADDPPATPPTTAAR